MAVLTPSSSPRRERGAVPSCRPSLSGDDSRRAPEDRRLAGGATLAPLAKPKPQPISCSIKIKTREDDELLLNDPEEPLLYKAPALRSTRSITSAAVESKERPSSEGVCRRRRRKKKEEDALFTGISQEKISSLSLWTLCTRNAQYRIQLRGA